MFKSKKTVMIPMFVVLAAVVFAYFMSIRNISPEHTRIVEGEKIVITVNKGENWSSRTEGTLFMKKSNSPQMAFWLEDMKGMFVATLYVTKHTAFQDWPDRSYDADNWENAKPAALPIWTHRHVQVGIHPIETCSLCHDKIKSADKSIDNVPVLDAFTGATPSGGFIRELEIPAGLKHGSYIVCAEINNAVDFNGKFRRNLMPGWKLYNGISGQPSILLSGFITTGVKETVTVLMTAGHGHPGGENGIAYSDMSGITTAMNIVQNINVMYVPKTAEKP